MTLGKKELEGHPQTLPEDRAALRKRVISYVENCQVDDGGYFFARISPASLMDTFYAVSTLATLGQRPRNAGRVVDYVNGLADSSTLNDWRGIFAACEVLDIVGSSLAVCRSPALRILSSQGLPVSHSRVQRLYVEVVSEFEVLSQAVVAIIKLGIPLDTEPLKAFLSGLQNADGSFGLGGRSRLASTYYATKICRTVNWAPSFLERTVEFLRNQEAIWPVAFIEDVFWLCGGLLNLGEEPGCKDEAVTFALDCERGRGGFSRATVIGIQTLESTYCGVSVLRATGYL